MHHPLLPVLTHRPREVTGARARQPYAISAMALCPRRLELMLRNMYMLLKLLDQLVDSFFPPPGGSKADVDAKFEELIAGYDTA